MSKQKTIFLTGIAGFIGFHTAKALANRGDRVIGLDNFNAYYTPELKKNRAFLLQEKGIEVIHADLNDRASLQTLFEEHPFTHVVHLAAQAGVRYARKNPEAYLRSNIDGFLALLETLRNYPHVKLTYASSSSVYGRNEKTPFSTTDTTDKPANLYAATKKANELMAYSYHHLYGIKATALRYFTVYGPWGRPDMAYLSFTEAILEGRPLHLFNDGRMSSDFTYIDDAVAATLAAIDYEGALEIFNIGNNHPVDLLTFVSILEDKLGIKAKKVFEGPSAGEVESTCADITESQKKLKYEPKTTLHDGLSRFIEWYRSYFSG